MTNHLRPRPVQVIPYTIGEQFATYVAYGETDHLNDDEPAQFDAIDQQARDNAPAGFHFAHWDITDNRDEFTRCEATDLMGACLTFNAVYLGD